MQNCRFTRVKLQFDTPVNPSKQADDVLGQVEKAAFLSKIEGKSPFFTASLQQRKIESTDFLRFSYVELRLNQTSIVDSLFLPKEEKRYYLPNISKQWFKQ